ACDAPWRIEPQKQANGSVQYGAIPIQITIHDAMHTALDDVVYGELAFQHFVIALPSTLVSLGKFQAVRIRELAPIESAVSSYDLNTLYEIEMTTGDWKWPANPSGHTHRICRRWLGEDAEPFRNIAESSEWHAGLWYTPRNPTAGTTLLLEIEVI